jgi:hypothetical protein
MRHLIAPSPMLEVALTSIRSSSHKGMRTHHPSVRRIRRDTPSYRLPELLAADPERAVFVVEGEKDVNRLVDLGLVATTNAGGAGKWPNDFSQYFRGRSLVVILADNDDAGHDHANEVAINLAPAVETVCVIDLPGLPPKGDVSDWLDAGGTREELEELVLAAPVVTLDPADDAAADDGTDTPLQGLSLADFFAYMPQHNYIFAPTRGTWPASSVNARIPPIKLTDKNGDPSLDKDGNPRTVAPTVWLLYRGRCQAPA